jgi:hypothetical protein
VVSRDLNGQYTTTPRRDAIMGAQDSVYDTTAGHYDECPQHADQKDPRCHCEGIIAAQDGYYAEPDDMREH